MTNAVNRMKQFELTETYLQQLILCCTCHIYNNYEAGIKAKADTDNLIDECSFRKLSEAFRSFLKGEFSPLHTITSWYRTRDQDI